jgi:predicted aminopeptidase
MLMASRSIDAVLADAETTPELRAQLELVQEARHFAEQLGLEVHGQYTSYVDWPGDRIITSVIATEPRSVRPADFQYPIIGKAPYRGFFDPERAEALAGELRARGLDVCVVGVAAYSTLGWLDDPITAPMLQRGEGALVETVLHELVHATVFVKSHPDFNEGAANFFGEEASMRFFAAREASAEAARRARVHDARLLDRALNDLRDDIAQLYAGDAADPNPDRGQLEAEARERVAALPFQARDGAVLADKLRLNDACLALQGTYAGDVGDHVRVLAELDGDLGAYLERLRSAAKSDDPRASFFSN